MFWWPEGPVGVPVLADKGSVGLQASTDFTHRTSLIQHRLQHYSQSRPRGAGEREITAVVESKRDYSSFPDRCEMGWHSERDRNNRLLQLLLCEAASLRDISLYEMLIHSNLSVICFLESRSFLNIQAAGKYLSKRMCLNYLKFTNPARSRRSDWKYTRFNSVMFARSICSRGMRCM